VNSIYKIVIIILTEEECILLARSPLGVQCEALSIQVNNRESIIYLVKNMIKLRILYVFI
jgi:hypothetical protein